MYADIKMYRYEDNGTYSPIGDGFVRFAVPSDDFSALSVITLCMQK